MIEVDEGSFIAKIMDLDMTDRKRLVGELDKLIKVRLYNERRMGELIAYGVESEAMTVESGCALLNKSKDSLKDLLMAKAGVEAGSFEVERYVMMREGAVGRALEVSEGRHDGSGDDMGRLASSRS